MRVYVAELRTFARTVSVSPKILQLHLWSEKFSTKLCLSGPINRLDYQPLFREISQRSLPKSRLDAWGEPLLISANQKLACTNPSGINYMFWLRRYSLNRPVRGLQWFKIGNIQDCDNEKCSRSWRMGILSFSTAWVRKLHWFSSWRQGQNTVFKSIAIAIFSSYFANVRASKNSSRSFESTAEFIAGKTRGPLRPTES